MHCFRYSCKKKKFRNVTPPGGGGWLGASSAAGQNNRVERETNWVAKMNILIE